MKTTIFLILGGPHLSQLNIDWLGVKKRIFTQIIERFDGRGLEIEDLILVVRDEIILCQTGNALLSTTQVPAAQYYPDEVREIGRTVLESSLPSGFSIGKS